ncbi:2-hydroxyacid dehydrogenase [Rugosibacter aromaticivorans]|uniref:2-hydroxyacid dehydrogenase n=1 Tax=Rugosibacter aromaticivorans TaxID=1565605 RepID=A0A0C5JBM8_9PROT|nr:D-glycerate dehydrogenase [Rugosibacter aromaticivorans]AJP49129.1 2-hydroxyacid dehydrogenase [Rugosibacter aromaticivorans]TBR12766.1 MAG: D-glycerate dehydrogenase [Rugosibacter sp.]
MKPKVLVTRKFFPELVVRLQEHFEVDDHASNEALDPVELKARLADKAGVLLSVADPLTAESIAAAPQLRAACNVGVGYNNIDVAACTRAGIMVTNTPDVLTETTADLTWALLMAVSRRLPMAERWLREGHWGAWRYDLWLGTDVHHATLGIFGMGRIGQALARRAAGFGMKTIYHNRARLPADIEAQHNATWVDKETLLREADFVVLLLPYSPVVQHYIGAAELSLMKPTAHLVNVARGGIVDDAALITALRERRICGAGVDVFEGEPKFNPDFLALDNVVLTPHIGSASYQARMAMGMRAVDNLIEALTGKRPRDCVNSEVFAAA